jgi:hypothetical protein
MKSQTTSTAGQSTRSQYWSYDPSNGRLLQSKTNALSQSETFTYDQFTQLWAKPKTDVGIDGLTTTYHYDPFGRVSDILTPRNIYLFFDYAWDVGKNGAKC